MVRAANRSVRLVHNAALLQTGMCFTLVTGGTVANPAPWIGASDTQLFARWWWPMGAAVGADGRLHVFLMEMVERGASYLANPEPVATWVASIALGDLAVQRLAPAPDAGNRLYGWSITSDEQWTYLYANCNRQFGWTPEGHDPCTANVYLARVPDGAATGLAGVPHGERVVHRRRRRGARDRRPPGPARSTRRRCSSTVTSSSP